MLNETCLMEVQGPLGRSKTAKQASRGSKFHKLFYFTNCFAINPAPGDRARWVNDQQR